MREAVSAEELRLRDVVNCLGARTQPSYKTREEQGAGESHITVRIDVPKVASLRLNCHSWSFTQSRPSAREARQAAAHEAATFLRSRFRSIFDDSLWSSVPHYHSHVYEDEEEEEEVHSNCHRMLFGSRLWYRGFY